MYCMPCHAVNPPRLPSSSETLGASLTLPSSAGCSNPRSSPKTPPAFFCYLLECGDGSFYTGLTTDPQRREKQHNLGTGARYTRQHRPVRLVYVEPQPARATAMRRELAIKSLSHAQKARLAQEGTGAERPSR